MSPSIKTIEADNLVCVQLDVHLWGGRQALKREHLQAYDPSIASLPPSALASMGSVKICDPEEVRVFQRFKNEAQILLRDAGLPIFGADGIPKSKFDEVYLKLLDIQRRFDDAAQLLFNQFDSKVAAWRLKWKNENPGNAHILGRAPDAQSVFGKLSFGFHCYNVNAPAQNGHTANDQFVSHLKGLKGELFGAAAAEANDLLTKYLVKTDPNGATAPKEAITQKTLRPLKRVAAKLRSFSFVDPTATPLAETIEWTLSQLPNEGPIDGKGLMSIWSLARMLSNPVEAARIAEAAMVCGPAEALGSLQSPAAVTTAVVHVERPIDSVRTRDEPVPEHVTVPEVPVLSLVTNQASDGLFGNASSFL